jgi:hypothetical protein
MIVLFVCCVGVFFILEYCVFCDECLCADAVSTCQLAITLKFQNLGREQVLCHAAHIENTKNDSKSGHAVKVRVSRSDVLGSGLARRVLIANGNSADRNVCIIFPLYSTGPSVSFKKKLV